MNGRIYDARIARFLQADPLVQAPDNTQSLNRYSYVWNNPLNSTDPSGYKRLGWVKDFMQVVKVVAVIVAAFYTGGAAAGAYTAAAGAGASTFTAGVIAGSVGGAVAGGMSAMLAGGSLKDIAKGSFTGSVMGAIGGALGHAVGLGTSVGSPGELIAKMVVGGTLSRATGGKFANGAAMAGFMWTVNFVGGKIGGKTSNSGGAEPKGVNEDVMRKNHRLAKKLSQTRIVDENGNLVEVRTTGNVEIGMGWEYKHKGASVVENLNEYYESSYTDESGVRHSLDIDFSLSEGRGDTFIQAGSCSLDYACAPTGGNYINIANPMAFHDGITIAHEFGHNLGFHHFKNGNDAFMSYDANVSIQGKHIGLIEKYYYSE